MGPNILEHTNRVSVVTMDIYLYRPRTLINASINRKKTQNMSKKSQQMCQSKWLANFSQLRLDADSVSCRHICRKYPYIADQKWRMFIGKFMNRGDAWSSHQQNMLLALPHEGHQ